MGSIFWDAGKFGDEELGERNNKSGRLSRFYYFLKIKVPPLPVVAL